VGPSPALILSFPATTTAAERDRLVALLAESGLVAIHENEVVNPSMWTVYFTDGPARDAAALAIRSVPELRNLHVVQTEIEDEDWARRTQADLGSIRIGRVTIAPPWDIPDGTGDSVVIIEPSRGFGTGHHQSTRLCLALLQSREMKGRRVIDVGTGSGVLAITAARLGAAFVLAIDVDSDAVENARENAVRNDVSDRVEIHVGNVSPAILPAADIVIANLTGSLLERHAGDLTKLVGPEGVLIAGGFTIEERDRVVSAFEPRLVVVESAEEDDWVGLTFICRVRSSNVLI
jgi:ribosomal protein L11 methyltransferase